MERRVTRWNGEGPEGTERLKERKDLKELREARWNGRAQDETEEHKLERWTTR